ncbi:MULTISPECIES: DUF1707 domain-containing protein [unclassified Rhodococcus (in: high G+C Gram-positive bacteria)]|uniref:DUF1707 SHOCT-like domain-containing protein n=1 Tax=unclassified Rhodococcus (in: high G+C Gram-positive bacteria) TaxID=192944 RepID=UPI001639768A|nr:MULTISPECIES: DUF1707 domain-containing protein [unclassified Rhodococcus (in: high G+C Gram-positive bacteria)]MBC2643493.1 DUF1707 domain-containing protein [Rhodococcus sp. 3A]MBC2891767.1 DUF1707 domain-containing protein [Rhodococcus sp. 4CII]
MSDVPEIRIGTAEREQALNLLSEHFAAGRLTVVEFDERSLAVTNATTRGELERVFTDLPATTADSPATVESAGPESDQNWRRIVMSVIPLVALVLFFVVPVDNSWLFFLMIPAAGAILFGTRDDRHRDRRRDRDQDR